MIKYVSLHGKQLLLSTVRDSLSWLLMLITGIGALIAFLPAEFEALRAEAYKYNF